MSAMEERFVFERTVTKRNGRIIIRERSCSGLLDADGVFRPCARCGRYDTLRQEPDGAEKSKSEAA